MSAWVSGNWSPTSDLRFVYDGWNLIAILNSDLSLRTSFMWGLDLSGSAQGAGGVGGLIEVNDTANGTHFAAYDGNGNVTALVKASDGTVSARYEYGPFGELLRATGPMAKANPFRFSTKYQDDESDLVFGNAKHDVQSKLTSLPALLDLPAQALAGVDVARMNLLCAQGLPEAENASCRAALLSRLRG